MTPRYAPGTLQATLSRCKYSCPATIHVFEGFQTLLISYRHSQEMAIISLSFPVLEVKHINRFKVSLLTAAASPSTGKEYFELKSCLFKPITVPPMTIHLKEDATPFAIHTPHHIPFALQTQVKEEFDSMKAQGINKPSL